MSGGAYAWVCAGAVVAFVAAGAGNCGIAERYGPPVMEAAIKHFHEVLEREQVGGDRLHCEVEVHQGTALMLCEAKLPGGAQ